MARCKTCDEIMEGDGYSYVLHCPYAKEEEVDGKEPDASPVYCTEIPYFPIESIKLALTEAGIDTSDPMAVLKAFYIKDSKMELSKYYDHVELREITYRIGLSKRDVLMLYNYNATYGKSNPFIPEEITDLLWCNNPHFKPRDKYNAGI